MSTPDNYDETTAIRRSYSQELNQGTQPNATPGPRPWHQKMPKRYIVAFMAFLGFCNIYALRVNLSVAIVAMVSNQTIIVNGTQFGFQEFDWSPKMQGILLGSFFYGYIITQIPGGWLSSHFGGKYLFGGGILATALLTLITPPAARISIYFLITLRILEGFFEGVTYPCIHSIWSKWAPPMERSRLATIAFSGSYVGTVIAMPLSGVIADTIGWPWIFYIFAFLAMLWYLAWCYFIIESPADHTTISHEELEYIQHSIGYTEAQTKEQQVPWKAMFKSLPVWAIIAAHFAENWGFYTLLTELPTFLRDVFHYHLYQAGFLAALPYLLMAIVVQLAGQVADMVRRRGILSTTNTRKICTSAAFVAQTIFMLATAYTMTATAAVACLTMAAGVGGFAWAGFSVNHLDIAPQHAGILMGISNTVATIGGIVSPGLTGAIVQHGGVDEWRIIFYLAGAIYLVGAVLYAIFASGEKQKWAEVQTGYQPHLDNMDTTSIQESEEGYR